MRKNINGIGKRIRRSRLGKKLSQRELAIQARLDTATICHFEVGRRVPSVPNLMKVAKALGVSTDYLLGM